MKDCKVKAVLIDLDGTLVNTLPDRITAIQYGLKRLGLPAIDDQNVQHYIGDGVWLLAERALQESLENNLDRITDELIQALADEYEAYYLAHICEQTVLSKGALELLQALKERNIAIALITNKKNELTYALLKSLNVYKYFDVIIAGQDGAHKPAPDLLLKALQALNIGVIDAVMIGDSLDDREAAKLASVDMIGVAFGYRPLTKNDVQYLMDDLQEALPYLMNKEG
ncbi:HAD family hydrolase [Wohlfahrtiimonas larvae]|uniref:phosphoglycolate phosphatase n=1 Tax=Wohlfahrtiimonas larvae TaxID=1157986 RepID=A0ABP9MIR4_9GAMM|nr:HAD-IA family hydrolase [Wohlfahrtiimonas larvae]